MIAIFVKEINDFLNSLIAYITIGVFLSAVGLLMWVFPETSVLSYGYASMETLFSLGPYIFMFLIPAITMKSFAEEKRTGTIELLYTLPFSVSDIVWGKFLAGFFLVIFSIIPTIVYYYSLSQLGNPPGNMDTPGIIGSYIGLIALGGVFTSIGIFSSALTNNQIVSFVLSAFLCFILYTGFDSLSSVDVWLSWSQGLKPLGVIFHYESMSRGLIDSVNVGYFVFVMVLMLFSTQLILGLKK